MSLLFCASRSHRATARCIQPRSSPFRRHFGSRQSRHWQQQQQQQRSQDWQQAYSLPPVRIIGPTITCLSTAVTIYLIFACWEVSRDARQFSKIYGSAAPTFSFLEEFALRRRLAQYRKLQSESPPEIHTPMEFWQSLSGADKFTAAVIATNIGMHAVLSTPRTKEWAANLAHMPAAGRNYTMFTSMFVHGSGMHLALNMYCLYNFGSSVAHAKTFQDSGAHFAAFYLSAGVLSSLGAQVEALAPSRRLYRGVGASGAIMALVGMFATSFPDARIGILFVPGRVDASTALGLIAAFEAYGAVFGYPFLNWGHSVHLAGLMVGAAYAHWDKEGAMWAAIRKTAFNQMRRVNLV